MRVLKRSMPRGDHLRRGAAAAEFAIVLPFLAFILLITVDFCRLYFTYNTITNCARNGALWASDPLANGTVTPSQSPYATVQAAAMADAYFDPPNDTQSILSPALTASDITQTSGTDGTGPGGIGGNPTAIVTVTYQFNLMTSYLGFKTVTISRQVTMRVAPATPN
jgi:Flp pilus assembly protein TadG